MVFGVICGLECSAAALQHVHPCWACALQAKVESVAVAERAQEGAAAPLRHEVQRLHDRVAELQRRYADELASVEGTAKQQVRWRRAGQHDFLLKWPACRCSELSLETRACPVSIVPLQLAEAQGQAQLALDQAASQSRQLQAEVQAERQRGDIAAVDLAHTQVRALILAPVPGCSRPGPP